MPGCGELSICMHVTALINIVPRNSSHKLLECGQVYATICHEVKSSSNYGSGLMIISISYLELSKRRRQVATDGVYGGMVVPVTSYLPHDNKTSLSKNKEKDDGARYGPALVQVL